jgi:hypothetical protein
MGQDAAATVNWRTRPAVAISAVSKRRLRYAFGAVFFAVFFALTAFFFRLM